MIFFTPKYLKHAKLLHKGVTRFLHYKRDLLPQAKLDEINGLRSELEQAIKARDIKRIEAVSETLNRSCERALPGARTSAWTENIEVFFVSIVIALGIRAYIAQPFQIPTGSMQPTLNGIRAERSTANPDPGLFGRTMGLLTGTSYLNAVSDHDGYLDLSNPITEDHFLIFRPYSVLHFEDGHTLKIKCPIRQLTDELQLYSNIHAGIVEGSNDSPDKRASINLREDGRIHIKVGQILARGIVHNGDYVIVNKFAYHFRQPTRGDVFVFTTKNIAGIGIPKGQGSQHYIKRLAGVPGDHIEIRLPQDEELWRERENYWLIQRGHDPQRLGCELWINGKKADSAGHRRVMDRKEPGYNGYTMLDGRPFDVTLDPEHGQTRYLALGDNSANSSDGRYWGTVPDQNAVGPGWFCYWPLTSHWGVIR